MKRIAIIGSGDLALQIAYHAVNDCCHSVVGFYDDFEACGVLKNNIPILGNTAEVIAGFEQNKFDCLAIGVGYKNMAKRGELFDVFKGKIPFINIIHSSCTIDKNTKIGEGVVLFPGCVIDMNTTISDNVLLYTGCIVSHDVFIGKDTMFSPGVTTSGFVTIGQKVSLGTGTLISNNLTICDNVKTGVGTVIVSSLNQPGLYYGTPAKWKRVD